MDIFSLETYNYHLPPELIAQYPVEPRDASRLLVLDRQTGEIRERIFRDLPELLGPEWVVVLNRTRVVPARLHGIKEKTGARVEILLLKPSPGGYEALVRPAKRLPIGTRVTFSGTKVTAIIKGELSFGGGRLVAFENCPDVLAFLDQVGEVPLPPYINRPAGQEDQERYQTVFARTPGSAAAPTAGLHFTPEILEKMTARGVQIIEVLLHVGLGTFRPVEAADIRQHEIHSEFCEISIEAAAQLNQARRMGKKVLAVGTTVVRTLESMYQAGEGYQSGRKDTRLFIYPGYEFRAMDAMITNFHLPKSSLLMLVTAFTGLGHTLDAYRWAVNNRYRFFSYGDAMLII
ncbi:MAG: tRNA preQ1(34) S-adenosylmethionine ribosyltransferase-isomerase QueA [Methylocystaceae bacterium]